MGTSVGGVNPVALDLPVICQVSVPSCMVQLLLAWFQFGSHIGQKLLYLFGFPIESAGSCVGFQLATIHCSLEG